MRTAHVLLLTLAASALARDASFRDEQLEAELISDCTRLQAGATARIGVRFVLQPGWHLYWQNPGDSGLAPTVSWELPDGYAISDLMWPAPHRIPMPPLMTFGYDDGLLLLAELTIPRDATGTTARLVAHVNWLTCADVCLDGEARLELAVPVDEGPPAPDARRREAIEGTLARIPVKPEPGALEARRDGDDVLLATSGARPVAYFPARKGAIDFGAPQTVDGSALRLRPADRAAPPGSLDGVLVLADGSAWIVDVPVAADPRAPVGGPSWAFYLGAGLVIAILLLALVKLVA